MGSILVKKRFMVFYCTVIIPIYPRKTMKKMISSFTVFHHSVAIPVCPHYFPLSVPLKNLDRDNMTKCAEVWSV